jgi:hypothetical protein
VEFPGYTEGLERFEGRIGKKRLKVPPIGLFQKAFTSDARKLGTFIGPIDFFDGMDAIMLSALGSRGFRHLVSRMIHTGVVKDSDNYSNRVDPRAVPRLENVEVPLVTIVSAFLSVHVLNNMYESDKTAGKKGYAETIRKADKNIIQWASV